MWSPVGDLRSVTPAVAKAPRKRDRQDRGRWGKGGRCAPCPWKAAAGQHQRVPKPATHTLGRWLGPQQVATGVWTTRAHLGLPAEQRWMLQGHLGAGPREGTALQAGAELPVSGSVAAAAGGGRVFHRECLQRHGPPQPPRTASEAKARGGPARKHLGVQRGQWGPPGLGAHTCRRLGCTRWHPPGCQPERWTGLWASGLGSHTPGPTDGRDAGS